MFSCSGMKGKGLTKILVFGQNPVSSEFPVGEGAVGSVWSVVGGADRQMIRLSAIHSDLLFHRFNFKT